MDRVNWMSIIAAVWVLMSAVALFRESPVDAVAYAVCGVVFAILAHLK